MNKFPGQLISRNTIVLAVIIILAVTALLVRLHNISDYKFYPDSYQNLIVAKNLADYGQVLGFLGPNGMVYPDFLGWTRPVYSLLILIPVWFGLGLIPSAQLIALIGGVLAVPVTYLMLKTVYCSRKAGLVGAALMAFSANHVVWGGFILTETAGIFGLLLYLWSFFSLLKYKNLSSRGGWRIPFCGVLLAMAILTRYEYVVVLIPSAWLLLQRPGGWRYFLTLVAGMCIILVPGLWLYQGVLQNIPRVLAELSPLAVVAFAAGIGLLAIWLLSRHLHHAIRQHLPHILIGVLWLFSALIAIRAVSGWQPPGIELTAWADFFILDFVIGFTALVGLTLMLRRAEYFKLALFLLVNILLLAAVYYRVNPAMQRYVTHELPFLIIPAAYGLSELLRWSFGHATRRGRLSFWEFFKSGESRTILVGILTAVFTLQAAVAYRGIYEWSNGIWFQPGYEERVARHLAPQFSAGTILITSLPEPYYLFTGRSTHSLAPEYPYLHMPNVGPEQKIVIIQDEGTRRLFPKFSQVLDEHMQPYKTSEFWAGVPFRYQADIYPEMQPVKVYQLKLNVLKSEIDKSRLQVRLEL